MGKILVLGGAGYIGSHTVYELINQGFDVVVVDNLSTGFKKAVHSKAKFYEADIKDKKFLDDLFKSEKIDAVIHFAAFSQVGESMKDPLKYYYNNLYGTEVVVKSMVENNVKNMIFSSTAAVYGEPQQVPITEKQECKPTNCYGQTKLAVEQMLNWVFKAHDFNYVCLRYFNACGAYKTGVIGESHKNETHIIPLILKVALGQKEYISIFGTDYDTKDGSAIRDYVHVTDLANAHINAIKYLKNSGKSDVFNLGSGFGVSVKELIKVSEKVTKKKIAFKEEERRQGDPSVLLASCEKAKKTLNWQPEFTEIKSIVETAYNWHKNNLNGFCS